MVVFICLDVCAVYCQQLQLAVEVVLGEFKQAKSAEQKVLHRTASLWMLDLSGGTNKVFCWYLVYG